MHNIRQTISDYLDGERDPALPFNATCPACMRIGTEGCGCSHCPGFWYEFNADRQPVSEHTMRCFVGMLETGEAVAADFDAVRSGLAADVAATLKRYQRKAVK